MVVNNDIMFLQHYGPGLNGHALERDVWFAVKFKACAWGHMDQVGRACVILSY